MIVDVNETTMVKPSEETLRRTIWVSNADLVMFLTMYTRLVFFYRAEKTQIQAHRNFMDSTVLKQALGRALVHYYPMAGRLKSADDGGRVEIDCNAEGVLFVEAETPSMLGDLGDFKPGPELSSLIPTVDCSAGIHSFPLLIVQRTLFKCGGVSLGVGVQHTVTDGFSFFNFMKTWSEMARGLNLTIPPFLDRSLLRARNPPQPKYDHIEYHPSPTMKHHYPQNDQSKTISLFKITKEQLDILISKYNKDGSDKMKLSSFEILAGHIWRCACIARALPDNQESKLCISTSGRFRLHPPLPLGYLGNAVFRATSIALAGDLQSKHITYAAKQVHHALARMDNDYLRSAIDYLELQPDLSVFIRGPQNSACPNFWITSWVRLPTYIADFGWGQAFYVGPAAIPYEGYTCITRGPANDGSLMMAIALQSQPMKAFEKLFYDEMERQNNPAHAKSYLSRL